MKKSETNTAPDPHLNEMTSAAPMPYMNRRNSEKKLMALLALGNPEVLEEHLKSSIGNVHEKAVGHLSGVPLTQAKYMGIALATLACRTAIDAGVPEQTAYAISDRCVQSYDTMEDPGRQWEIAHKVLKEFCKAISSVKLGEYSSAVRQCCEHIHLKLHSNVSLDELGEVCHLSPHYVSDLFRKEMGIGALQYAHQAKMQYAKYLLENTDYGIAEIASLLSYPSHSNFSQRFKRTYGVTPHEFRAAFGR